MILSGGLSLVAIERRTYKVGREFSRKPNLIEIVGISAVDHSKESQVFEIKQ